MEIPSKILIATQNKGKVTEIRDLVEGLPVEFLSLDDVKNPPEIVEDGHTFRENALKKARGTATATGLVTLADDSGLCVDALDGRPGVLSARYAGESSSDQDKYLKILDEMADVSESRRSARFVCVIALVWPTGHEELFEGICEGTITHKPRGTSGFGYDPIFYSKEVGASFGEIDRQKKNEVSHRARALNKFSAYLTALAESRK